MTERRRRRSFRGLRSLVCGGLMLGAGSALMADPFGDPLAEQSADPFADPFADPLAEQSASNGAEPGVARVFSGEASPARYEGFGDERRTVGPARLDRLGWTGSVGPVGWSRRTRVPSRSRSTIIWSIWRGTIHRSRWLIRTLIRERPLVLLRLALLPQLVVAMERGVGRDARPIATKAVSGECRTLWAICFGWVGLIG